MFKLNLVESAELMYGIIFYDYYTLVKKMICWFKTNKKHAQNLFI